MNAADRPAQCDLILGIGPVTVPEYLRRPQLVTRSTGNRLVLAEFDRWAEPIETNFARVLAENLSVLLSTDGLVMHPWRQAANIDYQVIVTVVQLEGTLGGDTKLHARWEVVGPDGENILPMRATRVTVPPTGPTYEALAASVSQAVEQLSRRIAASIEVQD